MAATAPEVDDDDEVEEPRACFDSLPLFVQSNILARLHWRDLLSASKTCTSLRSMALEDEHAWEARCRERF